MTPCQREREQEKDTVKQSTQTSVAAVKHFPVFNKKSKLRENRDFEAVCERERVTPAKRGKKKAERDALERVEIAKERQKLTSCVYETTYRETRNIREK